MIEQFFVVDGHGRYLGFTVGPIDAEACWTTKADAWRGPRWAAEANAKDCGGTVVPAADTKENGR